MIDDVVEVDVDEDEVEDVVDDGLEGSKRKYLCHAQLESFADISLFLMTTSSASMWVQSKADGLLTMMMKEEKQDRLEKEEIHKARINNHLVLYQSVFKRTFSFQADFSISKLIIKPKEANSSPFLENHL